MRNTTAGILLAVLALPAIAMAQGHSSSSATSSGPNASASSSASSSSSGSSSNDCVAVPNGGQAGPDISMGAGGLSGSVTVGPGGPRVQMNSGGQPSASSSASGTQSWAQSQSHSGCTVPESSRGR